MSVASPKICSTMYTCLAISCFGSFNQMITKRCFFFPGQVRFRTWLCSMYYPTTQVTFECSMGYRVQQCGLVYRHSPTSNNLHCRNHRHFTPLLPFDRAVWLCRKFCWGRLGSLLRLLPMIDVLQRFTLVWLSNSINLASCIPWSVLKVNSLPTWKREDSTSHYLAMCKWSDHNWESAMS